MKIQSAEKILKKWYNPLHGIGSIAQIQIEEAMKEYANQFVDLASEKASIRSNGDWIDKAEINKDSILKVKQLIK